MPLRASTAVMADGDERRRDREVRERDIDCFREW
jgi:hypothetical protein